MTYGGDMSKEVVQFLIRVEDAVVREIISRPDWVYALAPGLLVDRLDAVIRRNRHLVRLVRSHCDLRLSVLPVSHPAEASPGDNQQGNPLKVSGVTNAGSALHRRP